MRHLLLHRQYRGRQLVVQRVTRSGQSQQVGAAVGGIHPPVDQALRLHLGQQHRHVGGLDAQRLGQVALLHVRVGLQQRQHGIACWSHARLTEVAMEFVEYLLLRQPQQEADMAGQWRHVQARHRRHATATRGSLGQRVRHGRGGNRRR